VHSSALALVAFTSLSFLIFVVVVVLAINATRSTLLRSWIWLVAHVLFLASYVTRPIELLPLALFLVVAYALIEALRITRSGRLLVAGITLILASFVVLKQYGFLRGLLELPFAYLAAGLSYVLFRVLQLMIDAQQGQLANRVPPLAYVDFTAGFLTFTAGPIQTYSDYEQSRRAAPPLDATLAYDGVARVVVGFVKLSVLSAVCNYAFSAMSASLLAFSPDASWASLVLRYALCAACYTAYLYANFAGYMDIVIGVGALTGRPLPENFNHPFAARSFLEFWSRWHITLSDWFRTYLFNPLLKVLATRFSSARSAPYLAVVAFFVTFLVMGVWHGTTRVFVIYGLLMGFGASFNKLWQLLAAKRLGKARYKQLSALGYVQYLSRGLTTAYFALGLTCLWVSSAELAQLWQSLGALGFALGYLALTLGSAALFRAYDAVRNAAQLVTAPLAKHGNVYSQNALLGAQVILIVVVGSFFHKAPEFVYRAF
jgi:alginate O-acetyltransferase complex protein AlgI